MAKSIANRLAALEHRLDDDDDVLGIAFYGADVISVKGVEMTRAEFRRRWPDSVEIQLTWGDDAKTNGN